MRRRRRGRGKREEGEEEEGVVVIRIALIFERTVDCKFIAAAALLGDISWTCIVALDTWWSNSSIYIYIN